MVQPRSQRASLVVLLGVLFVSLVWIKPWARAEQVKVERLAFKSFPTQVGEWRQRGMDQRFDAQSEDVLNASDYLLRDYTSPDNRSASMFVGYYTNLEFNSNYHSPTVCLPGGGWRITPQGEAQVAPVDGTPPFKANLYLVEKGDEKLLMIYWYQGRGRFETSGFWTKFNTSLDGLYRHRSDGAIVRVIVPFRDSQENALASAQTFAAQMVPLLSPFVPK